MQQNKLTNFPIVIQITLLRFLIFFLSVQGSKTSAYCQPLLHCLDTEYFEFAYNLYMLLPGACQCWRGCAYLLQWQGVIQPFSGDDAEWKEQDGWLQLTLLPHRAGKLSSLNNESSSVTKIYLVMNQTLSAVYQLALTQKYLNSCSLVKKAFWLACEIVRWNLKVKWPGVTSATMSSISVQ